MPFRGIRLVEETEQKFRHIQVCFVEKKEKKTSDWNSQALLF